MPPRTMYHLSPSRNRDSITRHGLCLADDGTTPWVWLFADERDARRFLPGSFGLSRGHNDLWAADVDGLDILPDPHPGWDDVDSAVVGVPIRPERLTLVATHPTEEPHR